jgi:hypothetical protein
MKKTLLFLISAVILLSVLCTRVDFNNPVDAKGNSFMGDSAAMDDNGDGIANWFDSNWRKARDKTPPVIIFNGGIGNGDTVIVMQGDTSNQLTTTAKVTATDTGAIFSPPEKITIINSGYFVSQCNVYVVTYTATDEAGNSSSKTRIIIVDCDPPLITLVGSNPVNLQVGQVFIDSGATATDNIDGVVAVTTTGKVNTATEHVDTITYTARDRAGNVTTKKRLVVISQAPDTEPPVLLLLGNNPLSLVEGTPYTEPGWTATDDRDGNLHDSVKVTGGPVVTTVPGRDTLTYTVSDKAGHTVSAKRIIIIRSVGPEVDTIPPDLILKPPTSVEVPVGGVYKEPGWTAMDNHDGDLHDSVKITELFGKPLPIVTTAPTTYNLVYTVTDSAGNTISVSREVKIVGTSTDTAKPVITLEGCVKCTVKLGKNFVDPGATATDYPDGVLTQSIVKVYKNAAGQTVQPSIFQPATDTGNYTITYTVSDKAGNQADPKIRSLYVKDTFIDPNDLLNKYGVPLPSALPSVNYIYTKATTDGDEAPNVSNINNFQLDWNGTQLNQFRLGTTNGVPGYSVDLTSAVRSRNTFGSANPGFTLTGEFTALNADYFIKATATQCVWVQKNGRYAIILTK